MFKIWHQEDEDNAMLNCPLRRGQKMTIEVLTKCPSCGKEEVIDVPKSGYDNWKSGVLIQCALPSLSAAQREQLITGYCDPCWKAMWRKEEGE